MPLDQWHEMLCDGWLERAVPRLECFTQCAHQTNHRSAYDDCCSDSTSPKPKRIFRVGVHDGGFVLSRAHQVDDTRHVGRHSVDIVGRWWLMEERHQATTNESARNRSWISFDLAAGRESTRLLFRPFFPLRHQHSTSSNTINQCACGTRGSIRHRRILTSPRRMTSSSDRYSWSMMESMPDATALRRANVEW